LTRARDPGRLRRFFAHPHHEKKENAVATIKVLELIGVSQKSWHDAVENALEEAARTVRNITGVDVMNTTARIRDNKIVEYHANVKFAFRVENGGEKKGARPAARKP
jgi:flavin-binding protein dodecin